MQGCGISELQDNKLLGLLIFFILLNLIAITIYIINTQLGFAYIGPKEDLNYGLMFQNTAH